MNDKDKQAHTLPAPRSWVGRAWSFLERHLPAFPDPELDNRRDVYVHGAHFLGERLGCPLPAARDVVHRLCGERDETLLAEGERCDDGLLHQARTLLQQIRVQYLLADSRQAQRVTTLVFLDGNHRAERRVTETLPWDLLPQDVRDEHLRHGARQVTFQLHP